MPNSFRIGDLDVLVLSDGTARAPATVYFAGTTAEQWEPHKRWLDHEGNVQFPFGCFLVRSGQTRVLIDTGLGPIDMFGFKGGALLDELRAAGVSPEEINVVFVTHLHVDHCGTVALPENGKLQATFPKATYRWTSDEDHFWKNNPDAVRRSPGWDAGGMFAAVAPRFQPANDGDALAPGVNVIATPGHTPGHAGVILSSGSERAFVLGDAISCPAQLEETEWSGLGDMDGKLARRSQEAVLREAEGSGALLGTSHFPGLTFGRVLRGEGRRYWSPL